MSRRTGAALKFRDHRLRNACPSDISELRSEIAEAGLECDGIFGLEGPGWLAADLEDRLRDEPKRARLLDLLRRVEQEPPLIGLSLHWLAVGRAG
ncbi:MAG: hypothetical protein ACRD44_05765 [Bryobacteraceae bacterium]